MVNVEKSFADNRDGGRLSDLQLSARSNAKRELRVCPTENNVSSVTPLRFRWNLSHNVRFPRDVDGRIDCGTSSPLTLI